MTLRFFFCRGRKVPGAGPRRHQFPSVAHRIEQKSFRDEIEDLRRTAAHHVGFW
jgi:hypothetical protein